MDCLVVAAVLVTVTNCSVGAVVLVAVGADCSVVAVCVDVCVDVSVETVEPVTSFDSRVTVGSRPAELTTGGEVCLSEVTEDEGRILVVGGPVVGSEHLTL